MCKRTQADLLLEPKRRGRRKNRDWDRKGEGDGEGRKDNAETEEEEDVTDVSSSSWTVHQKTQRPGVWNYARTMSKT